MNTLIHEQVQNFYTHLSTS